MLLALDIGNSNISLGVFRGAELRMRAKISVQTRRSADEYAAILYDLLRMRQIPREEIGGCILSSVVPELTGLVEEAARTVTGTVPVRVGPGIRTGFPIRIDDPSQLGGDLVADTLAALTEYGAPLVLVDAGTVTTIAAVDGGRAYLGGCIVPGIRQGAAVLKDTAALLRPAAEQRHDGGRLSRPVQRPAGYGRGEVRGYRRVRGAGDGPVPPAGAGGPGADAEGPALPLRGEPPENQTVITALRRCDI